MAGAGGRSGAMEDCDSLFAALACLAQRHGGRAAALEAHSGRTVSYAELHGRAGRLAAAIAVERAGLPAGAGAGAVLATQMQRGVDWYCTYFAAARLLLPLVAMSTDLPDKDAERRRNKEIATSLQPGLLVADGSGVVARAFAGALRTFDELWARALAADPVPLLERDPINRAATLCLCYTGGTTRASRCVRVTHSMALHELACYPGVCGQSLGPQDRVLQQHSVYWAAAAFGELDLALAVGATLVFSEAWEADALAATIRAQAITCAGLVPSVMGAMDPRELPSLRLVFSWGEALPLRIAREWRASVRLVDLLISTECWLSLFADWGGPGPGAGAPARPAFRAVPGTKARLRHLEGAPPGAGELLLAGPMVTPGYAGEPAAGSAPREAFLLDDTGELWYCTGDCVQPEPAGGGFSFAGRAGDMVKVGGAWVDVRDVQRKLEGVPGVAAAHLLDGAAAVVLAPPLREGALQEVRALLPPAYLLVPLPSLPLHRATGKVDRTRLRALLAGQDAPGGQEAEEDGFVDRELASLSRWLCLLLAGIAAGGILWCSPKQLALELPVRALLLTFALLPCVVSEPVADLCRHIPGGACGIALALGLVMPSPLSSPTGAVLWALVSTPGSWLAVRRGRTLSWPACCLLGAPAWAREACAWWLRAGLSGAARWYAPDAARAALAPAGRLLRWARRRCGMLRTCGHCKKECSSKCGHADPAVDKEWYCDACWALFWQHRLCARCQEWKANGRELPPTGEWVCLQCSPQQSPDGRGEHRAAVLDDGAAGDWVIHLDSDMQSASAPSSQDNRLAGDGDQPCKRRRLDEGGRIGTSATDEGAGAAGAGRQPSSVLRCAEQALGCALRSPGDALPPIDSLRAARLASALRRELGVRAQLSALRRCCTVQELLAACRPADSSDEVRGSWCDGEVARQEFRAWGMMWTSTVPWVLQRGRALPEPVVRQAVRQLMQRHAALRARPAEPMALFDAYQKALAVLRLLHDAAARPRRRRRNAGWLAAAAAHTDRLLRRALFDGWPRVAVGAVPSEADVPLHVLPRSPDAETARQKMRNFTAWAPPLHVTLAPFGAGASEGAFVRFKVTHMFSDGFSIVPLLSDFADLVAQAELPSWGAAAQQSAPDHSLPAIPNAFLVLEERLRRTVEDDNSMRDAITMGPLKGCLPAVGTFRRCATRTAELPSASVAAIRRAAARLATTEDIAMLTVLAVTFARFSGNRTQPVILVAPQRDEPGASDLIGLLADFRQLEVRTGGLSLAGVCGRLHHLVRERDWQVPAVHTQYHHAAFVNFEWTLFEGRHGFSQASRAPRRSRETLQHPLQASIDEPSAGNWRVHITLDTDLYGKRRGELFQVFEESLLAFIDNPLAPIWPEA